MGRLESGRQKEVENKVAVSSVATPVATGSSSLDK
jgi:hypothetical protein